MTYGRGQSSSDNYSKLMDTIRAYPCIYDKVLREYIDQRIKKNTWQEIAKSLEAAHGINLGGVYTMPD